jgi:hypothetical protein
MHAASLEKAAYHVEQSLREAGAAETYGENGEIRQIDRPTDRPSTCLSVDDRLVDLMTTPSIQLISFTRSPLRLSAVPIGAMPLTHLITFYFYGFNTQAPLLC